MKHILKNIVIQHQKAKLIAINHELISQTAEKNQKRDNTVTRVKKCRKKYYAICYTARNNVTYAA